MPAEDVDEFRKIALARIHVERSTDRLKTFKILTFTIAISQVDLLNDLMIVVSALVNFQMKIDNNMNSYFYYFYWSLFKYIFEQVPLSFKRSVVST